MDELAKEVADLKAKLDAAHKKLDELEVAATNATKDAEAATAKLVAAEAAVEAAKTDAAAAVAKAKTDAEEALANEVTARVDARVALIVEAGGVLKDTDLSKMDDRAIKCAVIKHVDGDEVPAEKSMDYVTGVYEGALKRAAGAAVSRTQVRTAVEQMRADGAPAKPIDVEQAAKDKMKRDSATAWVK